jgi:thioredoxin-related protein
MPSCTEAFLKESDTVMKHLLLSLKISIFCLFVATGAFAQSQSKQTSKAEKAARTQGAGKADGGKYIPVHKYDPARNGEQDINAAVREASRTGKRVLLEVGGEWCIWCHIMDDFFEKNRELLALREKNFIMLKINYSDENKNEAVLSRYPAVEGYPHIFVLDKEGKLLHSQDTAKLEEGKSYNLARFMAFLKEWSPPEKGNASQ